MDLKIAWCLLLRVVSRAFRTFRLIKPPPLHMAEQKREHERALRKLGYSRTHAQSLASQRYKTND